MTARDDPEMVWTEHVALNAQVLAAATLGLEAIDNVLTSHEGQSEHAQLKAAFDALETALARAEGRQP